MGINLRLRENGNFKEHNLEEAIFLICIVFGIKIVFKRYFYSNVDNCFLNVNFLFFDTYTSKIDDGWHDLDELLEWSMKFIAVKIDSEN
ncbi:hypothetical protein BpHYR1_010985 [Brachionus plicatilis]|uniref:Uncharacterized protein n=1 Tax=Brachionus plicatilis TaxID=10195 RepID=A0A3M7T180_BRAPC|nr:hypothetical protein BpHYR1_010985 [Brachionus plicatilis]